MLTCVVKALWVAKRLEKCYINIFTILSKRPVTRLGKVLGFTGSVRCTGLNQFCGMQIGNAGIRQQQHVPTPSGQTSTDMTHSTKQCCVWKKHWALTTQLYTPQDYFINIDMTWLSFPTFLGLPQEIQGRNDNYAGCSLWQEMARPLPPGANVTS